METRLEVESHLHELRSIIQRAIALAEECPGEYRPAVFSWVATQLLGKTRTTTDAQLQSSDEVVYAIPDQVDSLEVLAETLMVPSRDLERMIDVSSDGSVRILGRIEGQSVRERQLRVSAVLCLIREKLTGDRYVNVEDLRRACVEQGCYDAANFTANFRKSDWLREIGEKGSRSRRYVASRQALEVAAETLRSMTA